METVAQNTTPKKGGRKFLKAILWIFIILILAGGGVFAWFYFGESGNRDPFTVIPNDAVFIIETSNLTEGWVTLSDSKMWQHLMNNKGFEDINSDAMSLDSLIKGNETLDMLFSDRKLLISAHMIAHDDYDFIFAVDLKKASKITFLKDYIADIVSNFGYTLTKRDYNGTELMMLTDVASSDVLSIYFAENVMCCSFSPLLIEKSVNQKDSGYWENNPRFKQVVSDLSSKKLFSFYLNYGMLDDYLRCFMDEPGESMSSLSRALSFSAFNVDLEDEHLSFSGYTGVIDSVPSYLHAFIGVKPGKMQAHDIISDRAAIYLSICFDDFNGLFNNLKKTFDAEDTSRAENYDKTVKKIEKYLKLSLEEDFFSWIGQEITFVKMQPTSNAREEDVVVTIHTKDIDAAQKGLDRIMKQVRKKSLGLAKFKDVEYKNYTISYLGFSGLLKMLFGKLFNNIERPYLTYIDDCVVMSNSPSCLMDVIDDYTMARTLARDEAFMDFVDKFDNNYNVSVFVQMPKIYSHLYYYSKGDKRKGIRENKEIIMSFTRLGFQLTAEDDLYKTTFMADFEEDAAFNEELESIESAAEELMVNEIDTGFLSIREEHYKRLPDGPARVFYDDSASLHMEGRIADGAPEGLWRIYYESGKIAGAINFEDRMAQGIAMFYYDNDKQSTMAEVSFKEGVFDGTYREFYENGERKASVEYVKGKADGEAKFFYDSGMIKIEGEYKDGEKTGKWKHYTETGELVTREKWKKDQQKKKKKQEEEE